MGNLNTGKIDTRGKMVKFLYYREPDPFDWYQKYAGVRDCVTQHVKENNQILNIGCGNSSNLIIKEISRAQRGYV
jgi:hypothetical protein